MAKALTTEILVVGAGPTGMTAALAAADCGFDVALMAPKTPQDPRTTALLMPAIDLLTHLGAWEGAQESAAPLQTMRIVDATDRLPRAPEIAFDADEIDLDQFGFNVPNTALNGALESALAALGVRWIDAAANAVAAGAPVRVEAGDATVHADFVVAADGSESIVREAAGIAVRRWTYDQAAFVTTLSHERPHGNTSVEFHTPAGPFTLVPLPGDRSSLVWVGRPDEAARWAGMDPGPLAREIERRAFSMLGRMAVDGPRGVIPMEAMVARAFGRGNIVLVGEAAHRFPPIGAQGLNLGMRDVTVLHKLLGEARARRSLSGVASAYDRRRTVDVNARTVGVDLLNRSLLSDLVPLSAARAVALAAARNSPFLRRQLMRAGLG
ncbi:MAG: FAD-dependent monooxygenase [Pseudomonadota bacterium]